MPKFNDTQVFPLDGVYGQKESPAMVVINAGSGSVAIEADMGDGTWIAIPDSPFAADTVFHLEIGNGRFRFTPSGDAEYSFTVR
ncbi:MAG: hypothetical protein CML02_02540 [Pseudooceanicola sp.]|nr:hypothetical protein [Pseudooceanicola sp.]|tara:strand:+ start:382 stop:633 length:252 start_codon:yes stop_codon:yes gene_type:complete